jgi:ABC-type multidrug transport system fused ATPase/permease subunit
MFLTRRLNIIVGSTGSRKSAMLLALLREMTRIRGNIYLPKSVVYCAQKPWLKNTSIKKNILFDSELDKRRYEEVLVAYALYQDLKTFELSDQTLVRDEGATLLES